MASAAPQSPQPGLLVQKYGGTSIGSPERIHAVADRIAQASRQGKRLVVVVSAMGHTTDELIELAHRVAKSPPHREMDMLLTAGERISMALLSMALAERQVQAVSFTGSQSGIITDASHRRARILRITGDRVRAAVDAGQVAIVAGFQGVSETKEITTLGRGGSDTTAVALAASLGAEACEIFTDVDGVYSADPRVVSNAKLWRSIPHDLMVELAVLGAGVLHPRCVELAKSHGVVLRVKNSFSENEGTEVIPAGSAKNMEEFRIVGVTSDETKALLTVELARPTVAGAIWDGAAQNHLQVVTPIFSDGIVRFFVEREAEGEWKKLLNRLTADGFLKGFLFENGLVPISVVGSRFSQDGAALSRIFDVLAQAGVTVQHGSASPLSATVAVPLTHREDAVRALHAEFMSVGDQVGEKKK